MDSRKLALVLGVALLAFVFLDSSASATPYYVMGSATYVRGAADYYAPTVNVYSSPYYYPSYGYGMGYISYPYRGDTYWKFDPYAGLYPMRPANVYMPYYPSPSMGSGYVMAAYYYN
ncbi:MAG: hypothetical protein V1494_07860 [Candidatus Diapherotrites archaeon]